MAISVSFVSFVVKSTKVRYLTRLRRMEIKWHKISKEPLSCLLFCGFQTEAVHQLSIYAKGYLGINA